MPQPTSAANKSARYLIILFGASGFLFVLAAHVFAQSSGLRSRDAVSASPESKTTIEAAKRLFARDNLIAWCIVPFDSKKRGPEERAAMLQQLGFKHFAYDWRAEHIPTFDAEIEALKRHGVALDAFWVAPAS